VDLGCDTRTSTQSRRIVRRKDASWSLNWPSGANLLARKQHMYFFGASVTTVCLFFFVIGRVLTRLDKDTQSRRIVRRKDASWSLNWPSGANLLARKQHMYFFGASVTTVCLFFFVIGRVLTRLD